MKFNQLFVLFLVVLLMKSSPVDGGLEEKLYEEIIEGYSNIDNEIIRWEMKREFLIKEYNRLDINVNGSLRPFVEILLTDDSQFGEYETILQPVSQINFDLTELRNADGSLSAYVWDMFLFRDNSIPSTTLSLFTGPRHKRFDFDTEPEFFSVNLEHYEFHNNSGIISEIKVNTEISTKNYEDGRASRTAIHLVKRLSADQIIFDYNWYFQEVSTAWRYFNLLDQPFLWVPLQIAAVILTILAYTWIHRFWKRNDIRIIKGKNKKITILELEDTEESGSENDEREK